MGETKTMCKRQRGKFQGVWEGLGGLEVLIGPQAPGYAATTAKVRYTSSASGKCRPTWGGAAGQKEERGWTIF